MHPEDSRSPILMDSLFFFGIKQHFSHFFFTSTICNPTVNWSPFQQRVTSKDCDNKKKIWNWFSISHTHTHVCVQSCWAPWDIPELHVVEQTASCWKAAFIPIGSGPAVQHLRESSHLGISNSYISQNSKLRLGIVITPGNWSQKGPTVCLQSMESGIYGTFLGRSCKRTNKDVGTFCSSRALLTT